MSERLLTDAEIARLEREDVGYPWSGRKLLKLLDRIDELEEKGLAMGHRTRAQEARERDAEALKEQTKKAEVTEDFTLIRVAFIEVDGGQHVINAEYLKAYKTPRSLPIESIPMGELVGRRINSAGFEDGKLVLGLTTKLPR